MSKIIVEGEEILDKKLELSHDIAVYAGLFGFGFVYNKLVERTNEIHGRHGYTSILVVFGVAVTLAALSTRIGASNSIKLMAGFAASGLPMILGDTSRHLKYKQEISRALAQAYQARKGLKDVGQTSTREGQGS